MTSGEGIGANGSAPPDANLAVGDTQVVETVNTEFAVFDKSGVCSRRPCRFTRCSRVWAACAKPTTAAIRSCSSIGMRTGGSSASWIYERLLDEPGVHGRVDERGCHWRLTLYEWNFGADLPDYPKFGVWSDVYYFSANIFYGGAFFIGPKRARWTASR